MKIIHCADLHLDASMSTHLDRIKARQRKSELLNTFSDMVAYACSVNAAAIIIAGDLFDTIKITNTAKSVVLDAIMSHPEIVFFYLKGNHDRNNFLNDIEIIPDNLKMFGDNWTSYAMSDVVRITGMELHDNAKTAYDSLVLDPSCFNIVTLHGQDTRGSAGDRTEVINIDQLKNKNIDYLALGHVHSYKFDVLDSRGQYAYPGCLEGRGFDECGEHGIILLDIDETARKCKYSFLSMAKRKLHCVEVDVTSQEDSVAMLNKVRQQIDNKIPNEDLVKIILTGEVDVETDKNPEYILKALEPDYYYVKVSDKTCFALHPERYAHDESLKGEFVRMVQSRENLSDEEKAEIIRCGFVALEGGDLL